jgi:hypothetical protein
MMVAHRRPAWSASGGDPGGVVMDPREELQAVCQKLKDIELVHLPAPEIEDFLGDTLDDIKDARASVKGSLRATYWDASQPDRLKAPIGGEAFRLWQQALRPIAKSMDCIAHFGFQVRKQRGGYQWAIITMPKITAEERSKQIEAMRQYDEAVARRAKELNGMMDALRRELMPVLKEANKSLQAVIEQIVASAREAASKAVANLPADGPDRERFTKNIALGDRHRLDMASVDGGAIADRARKAWTFYARCFARQRTRRRG